ncbi:rod shape-determining protein MreD [Clostridium sp. USBA 49]|jgi:rod shape-determining protein MreD|uniref:rod shape-determining protein MreD n=1 Tax=Clostridium TaxID=1485 RepID=UPI00099B1902|nr:MULTISPECIES: rod shape-determining protein MreD [Clostridium]SKA75311.1 rod shape-determining protein MreD [Clostridium sp. USBA 49]
MKKIFVLTFLCLLFFIMDNTIVPFFAIKGCYPSLLLLFVIFYSIINGSYQGIWIGVFSGILQDLYFFNGFGVNAFTNMIICFVAGYIGVTIFKEKSLVPIISSFFLTLAKGILVFLILYVLKVNISIDNIFYNSLYSMVVSIFMYKWVYKLCQKEYMKKNWSFYD